MNITFLISDKITELVALDSNINCHGAHATICSVRYNFASYNERVLNLILQQLFLKIIVVNI